MRMNKTGMNKTGKKSKVNGFILPALVVTSLCSSIVAAQQVNPDDVANSRQIVKSFMKQLKGVLIPAMKSGGPVKAIEICNTQAAAISASVSKKYNMKVARTSLKTRNPANKADAWEAQVLKKFEQRKAAGESVKTMEYSEVVSSNGEKVFRYMKAIPVGKPCLHCHGTQIKPAVKEKLAKLYPQDMATGYQSGDIRGAFSLSKTLK